MTEKDIIGIINSTSSHKAMGVDKISARMLKIAAPVIVPSVTKLINYSINSAVFPRTWKTVKVTPLFKRGDPSDVNNYCVQYLFYQFCQKLLRGMSTTIFTHI